MLQNTLANIEMLLRQQGAMDDSTLKEFNELLSHYRLGMWLYPGAIKRKLGLAIKEVYSTLSILEDNGYLESFYELNCFECQKTNGTVRTINEMPETFVCEICGQELVTIENSVLIYKVIRE